MVNTCNFLEKRLFSLHELSSFLSMNLNIFKWLCPKLFVVLRFRRLLDHTLDELLFFKTLYFSYSRVIIRYALKCKELTLQAPIPQNGQTHSSNSCVLAILHAKRVNEVSEMLVMRQGTKFPKSRDKKLDVRFGCIWSPTEILLIGGRGEGSSKWTAVLKNWHFSEKQARLLESSMILILLVV